MRDVRGGRIGLIFQEPMASLSMHYTIGNQIIESVVRHRKRSASIPAPDTVFADVAEKCDLVITGSGD